MCGAIVGTEDELMSHTMKLWERFVKASEVKAEAKEEDFLFLF